MITNEKFAEVLKSLTKEDFDIIQKVMWDLSEKFEDEEVAVLFTKDELEQVNEVLESCSDEVRVAMLVCKFKEAYEDVYKEELCLQQP